MYRLDLLNALKSKALEFYKLSFQIFALDVYNSNGQPLAPSEIYNHLVGITDLSTEPASVPIGILTSEHRDKWSKVFSRLSEGSYEK